MLIKLLKLIRAWRETWIEGFGGETERDKLVGLNVDGKIIFNWILKQDYVGVGLLDCSSRYVQELGCCGYGSWTWGSLNAYQETVGNGFSWFVCLRLYNVTLWDVNWVSKRVKCTLVQALRLCRVRTAQLRAGRSGDRILVGSRFSAPVQTGPGAYPASCAMGTGSFPEVKSGRGVTLTPHTF